MLACVIVACHASMEVTRVCTTTLLSPSSLAVMFSLHDKSWPDICHALSISNEAVKISSIIIAIVVPQDTALQGPLRQSVACMGRKGENQGREMAISYFSYQYKEIAGAHLKGGTMGMDSLAACERWQPATYSTLTSTSAHALMSAACTPVPGCFGGPNECSEWDATRTAST